MDAASPADSRPYWLPGDLDIDALPEGLRLAISQILTPAYEELVLAAPNALERATGAAILDHHLILSGVCRICQQSLDEGERAT